MDLDDHQAWINYAKDSAGELNVSVFWVETSTPEICHANLHVQNVLHATFHKRYFLAVCGYLPSYADKDDRVDL